MASEKNVWRVGDLARRTGVSVRTLHYYEEIGLLAPSHRTRSGHRLYTADDIVRLTRIKSLQMLGFGLDEIARSLDGRRFDPLATIGRQLATLRERIASEENICDKLERIAHALRSGEHVDTMAFLETIEVMTTDPTSERVRGLARRWRELIEQFTGGDGALEESVKAMYRSEPSVQTRFGLDEDVARYIASARVEA